MMNSKTQRLLFLTLFLFSALSSIHSNSSPSSSEDPEVQLCKKQCQLRQQFDQTQKKQCIQGCEEYGRLKKEIERRTKPGGAGTQEEPERKREHCKHECRASRQSEDEQRECERRCEEEYEREVGGGCEGDGEGGEGLDERLRQCQQKQCRSVERGRRRRRSQECRRRCEEEYKEARERAVSLVC